MDEKKCIIFFTSDLYLGGIESYIFRIEDWCKKNNWDFIINLNKRGYFDNKWRAYIETKKIKCILTPFHFNLNFLKDYDKIICISPNLINYLKAARIKRLCKKDINSFLYIMHPDFIHLFRIKFLDKLFSDKILRRIKKDIVFMDDQTRDYACNEFPNFEFNNNAILRLGYDYNKKSDFTIPDNNNILTITRLDFPFKGYVLGLIEDFSKLAVKYKDAKLTIIGEGKDKNRIQQVIQVLPEDIKDRINLIGNVPYEHIGEYIKQNQIFVGMGSTLLDATLQGVICIGAVANQEKNLSYGYFYENPLKIGVFEGIDKYKKYTFYDLIENIYNMDFEQKDEIQKKLNQVFINYYSLDYVMKYFVENNAKQFKTIPIYNNLFLLYYFIRNNIRIKSNG